MPLYALVDMAPNDENLFPVVNLANRPSAPPDLNGHRWLSDREFAPGETANIGLMWTGGLPAQFVVQPVVEVPDDAPTTQTEALDAAEARLREGLDLIAAARALG